MLRRHTTSQEPASVEVSYSHTPPWALCMQHLDVVVKLLSGDHCRYFAERWARHREIEAIRKGMEKAVQGTIVITSLATPFP